MSFASALTQALNIFSVVIDQALCIFGEKSAWGKKSAWEPDSQDPAYYAGLTDRGAKIVLIKEGGITQYFVVVHTMGPSNMNNKFTPWVEKEQTKEKAVDGQLRGVEQEVINL